LASTLAPGGVFACQSPVRYEMTHHRVIRETAGDGATQTDPDLKAELLARLAARRIA
jgi:hypothetical protein